MPFILDRWLVNVVELHPDDAARLGIASGDIDSVARDRIVTHEADTFDSGGFSAAGYMSDTVTRGAAFTIFAYPDQWANSITPRWMHPTNPVPPYTLARARITRIGPSELATMSFQPRNLAH